MAWIISSPHGKVFYLVSEFHLTNTRSMHLRKKKTKQKKMKTKAKATHQKQNKNPHTKNNKTKPQTNKHAWSSQKNTLSEFCSWRMLYPKSKYEAADFSFKISNVLPYISCFLLCSINVSGLISI